MRAWTSTGLATLAMLLAAAHPEWGPLGWGLVGAAGAIAAGQVFTFAVFLRGLVRDGLLISPFGGADADADADADSAATRIPGADVAGLGGGAGEKVVAACLASVAACRQAADVINRSKMLSEIGWLFVGAFSRMGTYAAITASASSLGVVPGAAHKVALEVFWLLSFLTEPVFTACNALLPRELGAGRYQSARKFRGALVAVAAALGAVLASVAAAVTTTGASPTTRS
jgi:Na+-driven multidrug efflux pump